MELHLFSYFSVFKKQNRSREHLKVKNLNISDLSPKKSHLSLSFWSLSALLHLACSQSRSPEPVSAFTSEIWTQIAKKEVTEADKTGSRTAEIDKQDMLEFRNKKDFQPRIQFRRIYLCRAPVSNDHIR